MYNKPSVAEPYRFDTHNPYTYIQRNVTYLDSGMFNLNFSKKTQQMNGEGNFAKLSIYGTVNWEEKCAQYGNCEINFTDNV